MPTFQWKGEGLKAVQPTLAARGWHPGSSGVLVVRTAKAQVPGDVRGAWVWVCGEKPSPKALQAAVDAGALDVVPTGEKGWEARLLARLEETLVLEPPLPVMKDFVAESAAAQAMLRKLHQAAQTSMPVLLTGEPGTGKELAARFIHQWSARRSRTFVPINCSAIPNELMEGELFGYVRGAFSGATRDYDGQLAAGEGGTVFLDEIDDTPTVLQNKLLRVLEDRVISRLGENQWKKVDFRVVAATNRDLKGLIARGQFGADLFERLATVQVVLPPLRERLEDLPALVQQLIARFSVEDPVAAKRVRVKEVTSEAMDLLRAYPWPGNIRELKNEVYRAAALSDGHLVCAGAFSRRVLHGQPGLSAGAQAGAPWPATGSLQERLDAIEAVILRESMLRHRWNKTHAAKELGLSRVGLRQKLARLGLEGPSDG